jgi:sugar phosphate isomerase/epimerase
MKFIACSTHLFVHEVLTTEHLAMIRQTGFYGVELWAAKPHWDYDDPDRVDKIARSCAHLGLAIVSLHGPFYSHVDDAKAGRWLTLYHEDSSVRAMALAELKKVLWTAAEIGGPMVVVHWEETGQGRDELGRLVEAAGEAGVRIALENSHNRAEASVGTLLDVLERFDSEAPVGLCFDTGHAHMAEDDLLSALRAAASRLLSFHVHDNDGSDDSHLVPYRGSIDWEAFAGSVRELGLEKRPFTLELRRHRSYVDDLTSARRAVDRMFGGPI